MDFNLVHPQNIYLQNCSEFAFSSLGNIIVTNSGHPLNIYAEFVTFLKEK